MSYYHDLWFGFFNKIGVENDPKCCMLMKLELRLKTWGKKEKDSFTFSKLTFSSWQNI